MHKFNKAVESVYIEQVVLTSSTCISRDLLSILCYVILKLLFVNSSVCYSCFVLPDTCLYTSKLHVRL